MQKYITTQCKTTVWKGSLDSALLQISNLPKTWAWGYVQTAEKVGRQNAILEVKYTKNFAWMTSEAYGSYQPKVITEFATT